MQSKDSPGKRLVEVHDVMLPPPLDPVPIVAPARAHLTADLSDGFFAGLVAMCERLDCAPLDLLGCWMNESGVHAAAHNPRGHASGIFQLMPETARGLGWDSEDRDLARYRALSAEQQLTWAERYYGSHRGALVSAAACYVATYLPALLSHAGDPTYVLAGQRGPLAWAYGPNASFDRAGKGYITVSDLTAAIARACVGPRWEEIVARLRAVTEQIGA